jgi:lysophospholipase L1-like esterase
MYRNNKVMYGRFAALLGMFLFLSFTSQDKKIKIYLIGDSTMCLYEPSRAPVTGWGMPFSNFFDSGVKIENKARGGRSTRTFISENRWKAVIDSLSEGDYVFMQFGHNDEAKEEKYKDRYTPIEDYKKNLILFIAESRSKKANPVLVTPVSRMKFDKDGNAQETHTEYTNAVYEVAKQLKAPIIDLDKSSRKLYQKLGPERTKMLFMQIEPNVNPIYPEGVKDNTHFNELGAREIAQLVLDGIRILNFSLADHIVKPTPKK